MFTALKALKTEVLLETVLRVYSFFQNFCQSYFSVILSWNTISFTCFKTQQLSFCYIWLLLGGFKYQMIHFVDIFCRYSPCTLIINHLFILAKKFYFSIPHLLDFKKFLTPPRLLDPLCITASGNILASGNISLKLFMAPLETIELSTF